MLKPFFYLWCAMFAHAREGGGGCIHVHICVRFYEHIVFIVSDVELERTGETMYTVHCFTIIWQLNWHKQFLQA